MNSAAPYLAEPAEAPRFQVPRFAAFASLAVLLAIGLAWAAARAEAVAAPLVVFPLAVGLVLAGLLAAAFRLCRVAHFGSVVGTALCAGLIASAAQHVWSYRAAVARARQMQLQAEAEAARQMGRKGRAVAVGVGELLVQPPTNLWQFLRDEARRGRPLWNWHARGPLAWLWWTLDALLVAGAASGGAARLVSWPYCNQCGSWYRSIRAGPLRPAAAAEVAAGVGLNVAEWAGAVRARVMACECGCGPAVLVITARPAMRAWRGWISQAAAEQVTHLLRGPG